MPVAILILGALLVITAFNNSFGTLATALETDIPPYFVWAAAIAAICAIGYVPGLRTPSRYLLALVLMVILLANYTQIFAGFTSFASSGATTAGTAGAANPTAAYTANPATTTTPTQASISGVSSGATTTATTTAAATQTLTAAQALAANPLNPNAYVGLAAGFGGLA